MPARYLQLLRRDGYNAAIALLLHRLDLDVEAARHGRSNTGCLILLVGELVKLLLLLVGQLSLFLLNNLGLWVVLHKQRNLHLVDAAVACERRDALLLVEPLHCAGLEQQRILERGVEDQEAVVLLVEHVVAGVGDLLGALFILWADGLEDHRLLGTCEHLDQVRQHALDRIEHVRRDDSRATFFLVAVRLAGVGAHCLDALFLQLTVIEQVSLARLIAEVGNQLGVGHLGHAITRLRYLIGAGAVAFGCS